LNNFRFMPNR